MSQQVCLSAVGISALVFSGRTFAKPYGLRNANFCSDLVCGSHARLQRAFHAAEERHQRLLAGEDESIEPVISRHTNVMTWPSREQLYPPLIKGSAGQFANEALKRLPTAG